MVGRHAAARQAVEEHRHIELLAQAAQRLFRARPVQPRAGHHHRSRCPAQQGRGAIERVAVGGGRGRCRIGLRDGRGRIGRAVAALVLHEHLVERQVEERRPRRGLGRRPQRLVHEAGDLGGCLGGARQLGHRRGERHVVDLLKRALAPAKARRPPAEHQHRRRVLERRGHRAHPVGHARARR
jgi:hypothetical protein